MMTEEREGTSAQDIIGTRMVFERESERVAHQCTSQKVRQSGGKRMGRSLA